MSEESPELNEVDLTDPAQYQEYLKSLDAQQRETLLKKHPHLKALMIELELIPDPNE